GLRRPPPAAPPPPAAWGGGPPPAVLAGAPQAPGPLRRSLPWLCLHLVAFAAFLKVTASLCAPASHDAAPGWPPVLAWLGLAGAVAATAAAAAIAPWRWVELLRRGWGVLAAGLVVGVVGWEVGQASRMSWDT